jgi:hypothetical protein
MPTEHTRAEILSKLGIWPEQEFLTTVSAVLEDEDPMGKRTIRSAILFGIKDREGVIYHVIANSYGRAVEKYKRCRADMLLTDGEVVDPESIPEPEKVSVVCEGVNLIL